MSIDLPIHADLRDEASRLLKALSHPARLQICCELRGGEVSVGELETRLDIQQPRLSRELAKLREEGLVETRRASKVIFYRLNEASRVERMVQAICAVMMGKPLASPAAPDLPQSSAPSHRPGGYGVFARPLYGHNSGD
ncbi:ArsR/SmtB family transcription factor [Woodsholea maritima]|uniref:ArsR/SmtB family transcription factor n=1 Tax=Woodsholea maritima TaxID=240237 RepID=UPI00035C2D52|nr:metalloregulator ArsR/SmtB family transcription factor [Woodsholea maritima]